MFWDIVRRARSALRKQTGTALTEYVLVLPIAVFFIVASLQLALVVIQYYSTMHITRETTRWLSITPHSTDATVSTYANNLRANLPAVNNAAFTLITVIPSCTVLVGGKCVGRDSGTSVSVTVTPNVASILIIPTSFQVLGFGVNLPAAMPPYRVTAMVE